MVSTLTRTVILHPTLLLTVKTWLHELTTTSEKVGRNGHDTSNIFVHKDASSVFSCNQTLQINGLPHVEGTSVPPETYILFIWKQNSSVTLKPQRTMVSYNIWFDWLTVLRFLGSGFTEVSSRQEENPNFTTKNEYLKKQIV